MEIQHFSHEHLLLYNERLQNDRTIWYCWGCYDNIVGPNYSCKECEWFVLHKSCAELPRVLHHPSHPKHPLILHAHNHPQIKCDGCKHDLWNFSYYCSQCNFNLDPKCASLPLIKNQSLCHDHPLILVPKSFSFTCDKCRERGKGMFYTCTTCPFVVHPKCSSITLSAKPPTIDAEIHEHPLILLPKSLPFTCDACGKEDKARFYFCASCSFVVHQKCTSLPSTVKVLLHKQHLLNLTYSLQENQSHHKACPICAQTVDTNYGFYYCLSCDFITHLHCAMKVHRDETFMGGFENEESLLSTIDVSPYDVVKKMKLGEDGIEIAEEIKHFSHEHELKLIDELDISKQCDGCVLPIFPPFYSCIVCRFFLHRSCAELPKKKKHSLHRHPLILQSRNIWCDVCRCISKGFKYYCGECDFDLDVRCSSLPNILKHDGHEHQLILCHSSNKVKCSCCDSSCQYIFRCGDCEFVLDFKCATLPHSAIYEPHEHHFKLWYTAEDDSGEYYCDICKEERDPKHWFYYCAECSYPAHPNCILKYVYRR